MIKLYDYGDGPVKPIEISRHDTRQSAPSGWLLAFTAIAIGLGVFVGMLGLLALYLRYTYGT